MHAFLALLGGGATMILLALGLAALMARLIPEWAEAQGRLSAGSAFVNLGCSFVAGAAGGYVTAWLATEKQLAFLLVQAVVALAIGGLSALASRGRTVVYQLALVAITPIGVMAGGLVRLRAMGIF